MRSICRAARASRRWGGGPNRARRWLAPREPSRLAGAGGLSGISTGAAAAAEGGVVEVVLKAETLFGAVAVPARASRFRERADEGSKAVVQITIQFTVGEGCFFRRKEK